MRVCVQQFAHLRRSICGSTDFRPSQGLRALAAMIFKQIIVNLVLFAISVGSAEAQFSSPDIAASAPPISAQWFAMHTLIQADPWPTQEGIEFSSWRSVSAGIQWSSINTSPGVYDWGYFDRWMARASEYGQTVLYTVYATPTWASSCPTCVCNQGNGAPGSCYPPNDLNSDGTGSDKHLKDFVTALMQHVGPGKIQVLEVWNEPNIPSEWGGTTQQLVSMARDIRSVALSYDANIKISSPAETGDGKNNLNMLWLNSYLAAGGGAYLDIIGLHGYVWNPEDIVARVSATTADMQQYGQASKPIWVTEGSWCCDYQSLPTNEQQGFSLRLALAMISTPVSRFYLYAFDSTQEANLWNPTTQQLTPNATTYKLYYNWLVGATISQPCQPGTGQNNVIWSCFFTKPGGYQAEAIWNTALPVGQTQRVAVSNQFVQYTDVNGIVHQIQNHQVPTSYNPIWLEN